jgi:DNA-binding NtrC family response regulator/tetratricopeptide (TPR) repeat protein
MARLDELYAETQQGLTRIALVSGPAGIGKSRLLAEMRSKVRLAGGVVLEGRADPGRAFGPFAEIVDRALRFLEEVGANAPNDLSGLGCRGGCHRLWHQHGPSDGPTSDTSSSHIAGSHVASSHIAIASGNDNGAPPEIAAFERRMRFFDAILSVLSEVARVRPPLVIIHQLEHADRGTLELLHFLLESAVYGRVETSKVGDVRSPRELAALFVTSVRDDVGTPDRAEQAAINPPMSALREHPLARPIALGTLDARGVRAYLATDDAVQRIVARTGGHPDLIDLLLEADPLTPEARIERRLARVSAPARELIHALAVLGRPATVHTLAEVAGVPRDVAMRMPLGSELGTDLLARSIIEGEVHLAFDRGSDSERCYRLVPEASRRAMHERSVDLCAARFDLEGAVRHAIATGDLARASNLAIAAAASLSARHAHGEAAALLEGLVSALGNVKGTAKLDVPLPLRAELADLYRTSGDYRAALLHARELEAAEPSSALAAHRVGHLLTVSGELAQAADALEHARALSEGSGDLRQLAEVEAQLAELAYQRGRYSDAQELAERALARARTIEALRIEIHARNTLGKLALAQKEPAVAADLFEENRRRAAHAGLGHQEAQAWTNLGVAQLLRRDLPAAEEACRKAVDVALRASDTRDRAIATENLAVIAHLARDYRRALSCYHQAIALLKRLGNRPMLARVAINLGELYSSLGDRAQARSLCELAAHVLGASPPPPREAELLLLRGRVAFSDGAHDAAKHALEDALALFQTLGDARALDALLELGRIALADGDVDESRAVSARLPSDRTAITGGAESSLKRLAEIALFRAQIARAAGSDALPSSRRAVELAERSGDDEVILPSLLHWGRALADAGDVVGASNALERARSVDAALSRNVPDEAAGSWTDRPLRADLVDLSARVATTWGTTGDGERRTTVRPVPASVPPTARRREDRRAGEERWERRYPNIAGGSPAIRVILGMLDKVAAADTTVLIRGESGTGKELVAEAIHNNSDRAGKPLVKVNCAALVESLLLSELFGHEKGAFTGAQARRKGRFELADGGTLFLDEIGDISPNTQVALLRVLQEREFERVGGTQAIRVDVRIVCATHRDLERMVRDGTFREDLYYRLRGVTLEMPALRKRLEDLPILTGRLLDRIATERNEPVRRLLPEALSLLSQHRWPGNVRELDNVLRSATLFAESDDLAAEDFAAFAESFRPVAAPAAPVGPAAEAPIETLVYEHVRAGQATLFDLKKKLERECIVRALSETNGNITRAAALLGMKRPRLSQLVKEYELGEIGKE